MAEINTPSETGRSGDGAGTARRPVAEAAARVAESESVQPEARHFAASARQAGLRNAEAIGQVAQKSLKTSQDLARQATDQATEFWRSSLTPMSQWQAEFGRWFDQMWRQAAPTRSVFGNMFLTPLGGQPAADLRETAQGLELCVELPGLKAGEIDLNLRGDLLVLSGEKADETQAKSGAYHYSERRFGRFERSFPLPQGADRSGIEASFRDGLLKVTIPISLESQEETPIRIKG